MAGHGGADDLPRFVMFNGVEDLKHKTQQDLLAPSYGWEVKVKSNSVVRRTTISAAAWEPCITSDGRALGEAEWLRRRTEPGWSHTAMLWRCEPMTFDYTFPGDETFLIISGEVRIDVKDEGETIDLRAGDVASFPKGVRSVWTILQPLEKFTVVSG